MCCGYPANLALAVQWEEGRFPTGIPSKQGINAKKAIIKLQSFSKCTFSWVQGNQKHFSIGAQGTEDRSWPSAGGCSLSTQTGTALPVPAETDTHLTSQSRGTTYGKGGKTTNTKQKPQKELKEKESAARKWSKCWVSPREGSGSAAPLPAHSSQLEIVEVSTCKPSWQQTHTPTLPTLTVKPNELFSDSWNICPSCFYPSWKLLLSTVRDTSSFLLTQSLFCLTILLWTTTTSMVSHTVQRDWAKAMRKTHFQHM